MAAPSVSWNKPSTSWNKPSSAPWDAMRRVDEVIADCKWSDWVSFEEFSRPRRVSEENWASWGMAKPFAATFGTEAIKRSSLDYYRDGSDPAMVGTDEKLGVSRFTGMASACTKPVSEGVYMITRTQPIKLEPGKSVEVVVLPEAPAPATDGGGRWFMVEAIWWARCGNDWCSYPPLHPHHVQSVKVGWPSWQPLDDFQPFVAFSRPMRVMQLKGFSAPCERRWIRTSPSLRNTGSISEA